MAYLTLSNISKQFGDTYAVQDFNLEVDKGEFVSFLGPSGCGKTTTLRMVAGFETPTIGTITLDGADITDKSPNQRNMGMIFQSYALSAFGWTTATCLAGARPCHSFERPSAR